MVRYGVQWYELCVCKGLPSTSINRIFLAATLFLPAVNNQYRGPTGTQKPGADAKHIFSCLIVECHLYEAGGQISLECSRFMANANRILSMFGCSSNRKNTSGVSRFDALPDTVPICTFWYVWKRALGCRYVPPTPRSMMIIKKDRSTANAGIYIYIYICMCIYIYMIICIARVE